MSILIRTGVIKDMIISLLTPFFVLEERSLYDQPKQCTRDIPKKKSPATFAAGSIPAKWVTKTNYPAKGVKGDSTGSRFDPNKMSSKSQEIFRAFFDQQTFKMNKFKPNAYQVHTKFTKLEFGAFL